MSCSAHTRDGEHVLVVQILWASDESDVSSGWKLCLAGDAPSSTLSNAPSSMPTHAPSHVEMRRRRSTALTTGAICWEARKSDYGCFGYTEVGYTCVGEYCAAMDPGGTPQDCAQQMPAGYVLDAGTGKCVKSSTAICWEARQSDYDCSTYTQDGYTCVGEYCASTNPSGTPAECAVPMPIGYVVDGATGRCVDPSGSGSVTSSPSIPLETVVSVDLCPSSTPECGNVAHQAGAAVGDMCSIPCKPWAGARWCPTGSDHSGSSGSAWGWCAASTTAAPSSYSSTTGPSAALTSAPNAALTTMPSHIPTTDPSVAPTSTPTSTATIPDHEVRVTSDGSYAKPDCSWSLSCSWNEQAQQACAHALCTRAGYSSGTFVQSSNNPCNSGIPDRDGGSEWAYQLDISSYQSAGFHDVAEITAMCATSSGSVTSSPSSAGVSRFSTTGPCTVEGMCVSSPNFGEGSYDNNEACTVHAIASGTISVNSFETEQCCDHLIVGGTSYSGSSGPVGVSVEPSTEVCHAQPTLGMVSMCWLCRSCGRVMKAMSPLVGNCASQEMHHRVRYPTHHLAYQPMRHLVVV